MDLGDHVRRAVDLIPSPSIPFSRNRHVQKLSADLYELDDSYLALFDAPGANQSDVQLKFVDGEILVRIDRFRKAHPEFETRLANRHMAADGRVPLPEDARVEPATATASLTGDGILRVTVPKRPTAPTNAEADQISS